METNTLKIITVSAEELPIISELRLGDTLKLEIVAKVGFRLDGSGDDKVSLHILEMKPVLPPPTDIVAKLLHGLPKSEGAW